MTKFEALAALRKLAANMTEDGIFLSFSSRYDTSVERVESLVRAAGGETFGRRRGVKRRHERNPSARTRYHVVSFTVGIDEDAYVMRRITRTQLDAALSGAAPSRPFYAS